MAALGISSAAVIDSDDYPSGPTASNVFVTPEATFTGSGAANARIFINVNSGFCTELPPLGCLGVLEVDFVGTVSNLSFEVFGFDTGDASFVEALDANDGSLGGFYIEANGVFGFGALSGISKLVFTDAGSTGRGLAYDLFTFDPDPIPVPLAAPLMLTGLVLVARSRRRLDA